MSRLAALTGERMALLVARLLSRALLGLLAIALVFFVLERVAPDDPARALAGPGASDTAIAHTAEALGLAAPLYVQALDVAARLAHFDLGVSSRTGRPVAEDLGGLLPESLTLLAGAGLGGLLLGIGLAVLAAAGGVWRVPVWALAVGAAVPVYGVAAVLVVADGRLHVPPAAELVLAAAALGLPLAQDMARAAHAGLSGEMRRRYVLAARAAGGSRMGVALRHALRNILRLPLAALATQMGTAMVALPVVERLFGRYGIGAYLLDAIAAGDMRASLGVCFVFALLYLALDVAVAVLRVLIDPRLRLE